MIKFTQTQKDEFDLLYKIHDEMTIFNTLTEIKNNENKYPVLYSCLFNSPVSLKNQDDFIIAWNDPESISVVPEKYYLIIFNDMYVSLDPDKNIVFTAKDDYSKTYQKEFTDTQINELQQRKEFVNKINLQNCKIFIEKD